MTRPRRRWRCEHCGHVGAWQKPAWRWLFMGGPIAVFCSQACEHAWLERADFGAFSPANDPQTGALKKSERRT